MATLQEIYNLRMSSSLRNRVAAAIAAAAEDVRNEAAATTHHAERFAWATATLESESAPQAEAERAMWIVVQNATIQSAGEAATDNDIQFVVNGLVNFLASVDTST
jgi:hypothetical protein